MIARSAAGGDLRLVAKELQVELSSETHTLYFHGESMRPFLVEGDEVVVAPVDWSDIRVGDVITYRKEDKFPTRRVVKKTDSALDLWCENWPNRRFSTLRADVLGRAVARRRDGVWLTESEPEWRAARRSAMSRYRRVVTLPEAVGRARGIASRILRLVGYRRVWAVRDPRTHRNSP